ncbi:hypothetical protein GCM10010286_47250 [Streptomyces toxytricini]|nr:hypothetical protein GCM10010286_47250 [Streptomyces toxytricini]
MPGGARPARAHVETARPVQRRLHRRAPADRAAASALSAHPPQAKLDLHLAEYTSGGRIAPVVDSSTYPVFLP